MTHGKDHTGERDVIAQQEQLRAQIHQGKQHQEHGDPLG